MCSQCGCLFHGTQARGNSYPPPQKNMLNICTAAYLVKYEGCKITPFRAERCDWVYKNGEKALTSVA